MRRIKTVIALATILLIGMVGCTSQSPTAPTPDQPTELDWSTVDTVPYYEALDEFMVFIADLKVEYADPERPAGDPVRNAQWSVWTGKPYNGPDGTNMDDDEILTHWAGQLTWAIINTWGPLCDECVTGCEVHDEILDQMFAINDLFPPIYSWAKFCSEVFEMPQNGGYDWKNDFVAADDVAPCP